MAIISPEVFTTVFKEMKSVTRVHDKMTVMTNTLKSLSTRGFPTLHTSCKKIHYSQDAIAKEKLNSATMVKV